MKSSRIAKCLGVLALVIAPFLAVTPASAGPDYTITVSASTEEKCVSKRTGAMLALSVQGFTILSYGNCSRHFGSLNYSASIVYEQY